MFVERIVPVLASVVVIIVIAVLAETSRPLAAILATMPLTVPLSMWVIWSAEQGSKEAMVEYSAGLFSGVVGLLAFVAAAWISSRVGLGLVPILIIAYAAWGISMGGWFLVSGMVR